MTIDIENTDYSVVIGDRHSFLGGQVDRSFEYSEKKRNRSHYKTIKVILKTLREHIDIVK